MMKQYRQYDTDCYNIQHTCGWMMGLSPCDVCRLLRISTFVRYRVRNNRRLRARKR